MAATDEARVNESSQRDSKKHARGEYEIGIQTDDGAVVARVSI
jgi:hypothetical protein